MIRTMLRVLPLRDPGGQVLRCKHSRVALQNLFVRRLICTARGKPPTNPEGLSAATVMDMASNKATRFVYLRTLPLVKQPELDDRKVDVIAGHIEDMTRSLCEKHASSIVDDRAAVHLHMAALAIATHRVLGAHIQDEVRLSNIIRAGFGAELLAEAGESEEESQRRRGAEKRRPDFWIVRAALWFSWNRMKAVRRMTANMMRDFGDSFKKEAVDELDGDGRQRHCLRVYKCYYHDICRAEGLRELTKVFCALDRAIYSPISSKSDGISFNLERTLADDDERDAGSKTACEFTFVNERAR